MEIPPGGPKRQRARRGMTSYREVDPCFGEEKKWQDQLEGEIAVRARIKRK